MNGIRAAFTKDFLGWLKVADPDVICIQESKAGNDPRCAKSADFERFLSRVKKYERFNPHNKN